LVRVFESSLLDAPQPNRALEANSEIAQRAVFVMPRP
jgi:hypothetical protein